MQRVLMDGDTRLGLGHLAGVDQVVVGEDLQHAEELHLANVSE